MTLKDWVLGAGVVLALGVAWFAGGDTVYQQLRSASSPSVVNGCMEVSGVTTCYYRQAFAAASTTCAFAAPDIGSSTLVYAGANWTETDAPSTVAEWGIGNTAYATTTSLGGTTAVGANGDYTVTASTTAVNILEDIRVVSQVNFVNFKVGSSSPAGRTGGFCSAIFRGF